MLKYVDPQRYFPNDTIIEHFPKLFLSQVTPLKVLTIRIYNHSPRKTRGKNVLKSVDGRGEAGVGQESLFGDDNNIEKMILVRKAFW